MFPCHQSLSAMFSIGNVLYRLNRTLVKGWELSSRQNVRCTFSNAPHDRVYDHVLVCVDTSQVNLTPTYIQVMHSGQVRVATCAKASTRQHRHATDPPPKREETQGVSDFRSSLTIRSNTKDPNRNGEETLHGFPLRQNPIYKVRYNATYKQNRRDIEQNAVHS